MKMAEEKNIAMNANSSKLCLLTFGIRLVVYLKHYLISPLNYLSIKKDETQFATESSQKVIQIYFFINRLIIPFEKRIKYTPLLIRCTSIFAIF